jgi:hypothetical protein
MDRISTYARRVSGVFDDALVVRTSHTIWSRASGKFQNLSSSPPPPLFTMSFVRIEETKDLETLVSEGKDVLVSYFSSRGCADHLERLPSCLQWGLLKLSVFGNTRSLEPSLPLLFRDKFSLSYSFQSFRCHNDGLYFTSMDLSDSLNRF